MLTHHELRCAILEYMSANIATPTIPPIEPTAACAANGVPYCSANKKEISPELSGSPANNPPTVCPQRRPASESDNIRIGVRISLRTKIIRRLDEKKRIRLLQTFNPSRQKRAFGARLCQFERTFIRLSRRV